MLNTNKNLLNGFGAIIFALAIIVLSGAGFSAEAAPYDFDGDGKTDVSIYKYNPQQWWHLRSSDNGNGAVEFGSEISVPVPGDYTGDGKTDAAYFDLRTGEWFILRSEDQSFYSFPFGKGGQGHDFPVPADYDGDGKTDPAVLRGSNATWFILKSSTGQVDIRQFGPADTFQTDFPVVADYDGDGKDDLALFPSFHG